MTETEWVKPTPRGSAVFRPRRRDAGAFSTPFTGETTPPPTSRMIGRPRSVVTGIATLQCGVSRHQSWGPQGQRRVFLTWNFSITAIREQMRDPDRWNSVYSRAELQSLTTSTVACYTKDLKLLDRPLTTYSAALASRLALLDENGSDPVWRPRVPRGSRD